MMGGDAEAAASKLLPEVARNAPSFAAPPDAFSVGWMEDAWKKLKSTATDAEAQPPKESSLFYRFSFNFDRYTYQFQNGVIFCPSVCRSVDLSVGNHIFFISEFY